MTIPCKHWRACGIVGGGCCAADIYARPSFGVCLTMCSEYRGPSREGAASEYLASVGLPALQPPRPQPVYLGDRVANGLKRLGVQPCGGCTQRQQFLNAADKRVRELVTNAS